MLHCVEWMIAWICFHVASVYGVYITDQKRVVLVLFCCIFMHNHVLNI